MAAEFRIIKIDECSDQLGLAKLERAVAEMMSDGWAVAGNVFYANRSGTWCCPMSRTVQNGRGNIKLKEPQRG